MPGLTRPRRWRQAGQDRRERLLDRPEAAADLLVPLELGGLSLPKPILKRLEPIRGGGAIQLAPSLRDENISMGMRSWVAARQRYKPMAARTACAFPLPSPRAELGWRPHCWHRCQIGAGQGGQRKEAGKGRSPAPRSMQQHNVLQAGQNHAVSSGKQIIPVSVPDVD